jgi:hypothetical protein
MMRGRMTMIFWTRRRRRRKRRRKRWRRRNHLWCRFREGRAGRREGCW